jgi:hypothetical protein
MSYELWFQGSEPKANSQQPKANSQQPKAKSQQPKAKSQQPKANRKVAAVRQASVKKVKKGDGRV